MNIIASERVKANVKEAAADENFMLINVIPYFNIISRSQIKEIAFKYLQRFLHNLFDVEFGEHRKSFKRKVKFEENRL